jgi:hypothetical protein
MHTKVAAVLMGLVIAAGSTLHATIVVPADLGQLSRDAVAIARGRVAAVDGRWTDDRRTIETIVSLDVEGYLKGALGATLQFRVPGGQLGRYRSIVVGAPAFALNDHVVVFLGASGPMVPYILGLNQGVYRVVPAAGGTGSIVTPPAMLPSAVNAPLVRGDVSRRPLPLGDFEQRIRALAGSAR